MKKWVWLMSGLLIFFLGGCLKMEQEVTLNKDGSGKVDLMYAMSEQTVQQMKALAEMAKQQGGEGASEQNFPEFDEARVKEKYAALKDKGITLKSVKAEKKGGWQYMYVTADFKDISRVKDMDEFKDSSLTITKDADGNYVIDSGMSRQEGMDNPEQMKAMLPMLAGMRIKMKFNTPGKIIETTAPIKGNKSAEWVFDVDKDPDTFMKMSKSEMKIVFDGKGCTIPEVK